MKRWLSTTLAAIMLLTLCAGCGNKDGNGNTNKPGTSNPEPSGIYYEITGIDPNETVITVDGNEISAQVFFYWIAYNCSTVEFQMNMYKDYTGMYSEFINSDRTLKWDTQFTETETLSQYIKNESVETVKFYAVLENKAKELGVVLTESDRAEMANKRKDDVERMGGEEEFKKYLAEMGVDEPTYERFSASKYLFDNMNELVLEEGSELYLPLEEYDQYATYADHILLSTMNPKDNTKLPADEISKKLAKAEELLAQLKASDDVEALFNQLADEFSEDTGRKTNPDGYIFKPGTMVEPFENAAKTLKPGEISDIVESEFGYHIILRKDLSKGLEAHPDQRKEVATSHLNALLDKEMETVDMTISEKLNDIDAGKFYTEYLAKIETMDVPAGMATEGENSDLSDVPSVDDAADSANADAAGGDKPAA